MTSVKKNETKPLSVNPRYPYMRSLARYFFFALLLFAAANIHAQWKLAAPNVITSIFRPNNGGGILTNHNGILWAGFRDIWMSADTGKTWSLRTPFDGIDNNAVKDISFFDDNTGLAATQNGEIYITQDQGLSWTQHIPNNPFRFRPSIESACFVGTPNNIIACSFSGDRYVSNDGGNSWQITLADSIASKVIPGSGGTAYITGGLFTGAWLYETNDFGATWIQHPAQFHWDSYSTERDQCDTTIFYAANDDIAARTDKFSRAYISTNTGNSWQSDDPQLRPDRCGSVSAAQHAIFMQTYSGIIRSTDHGRTWQDIGGPPNIVDTRFVTALDNNIVVAIDTGAYDSNFGINSPGSVWVTYNSGGDSLMYTDGSKLTLATADQSADTIGGSVAVPISVNGIINPIEAELTIHFDPQLIYHGTFSLTNVPLDIPGETWAGRTKIYLPGATSSGILAYSYFDVFNDSSKKTNVVFDSLIFCLKYLSPVATAVISPDTLCGADILTRFMLHNIPPQLRIVPNPSGGDINIISSTDLGDVRITVYDMLGTKHADMNLAIGKNTPAKLPLQLSSGIYNLHVIAATQSFDLRVIVNK